MREEEQGDQFLRIAAGGAAALAVLIALFETSHFSYVLFHSLAEMFSIVVACSVFVVFWNSRHFLDNGCFLLIGVGLLFVGLLDLLHILSYEGMGVIPSRAGDVPTQLWISARYLQSLSFVAAPLFLRRRLPAVAVLFAFAVVTALVMASIFVWRVFPHCFEEGRRLTPFKIVSEYVICVVLAVALALFYWRRDELDRSVFLWLAASIATTIAAELAFTRYISAYASANRLGHLLKLSAFFLVYKAFIEAGLRRPYALLFRNLKRSEEALRESEERFRQIATAVDDAFLLTDVGSGTVLFASPAYERIWGRPAVELYENSAAWLDAIHPEDRARVESAYRSLKTVDTYDEEYRLIRPDHSMRWIRDRRYVVSPADGQARRIAGTAEDVTARREVEHAALVAQQKLLEAQRQQREHVERELSLAKDQLVRQTRLATIGQIAASIVHDLRNPLAVIRNAAYLLKRRMPADEPKVGYYLNTIDQEVETANQIITNLMEAVRAKEPSKRELDLGQLAREVFERSGGKDVQLSLCLEHEPYRVLADPVQMRQVLGNLFANAIEAMNGEGRIELKASRQGQMDVITVRDTGEGIPEHLREQIFEPLVSSRPKGTGLGLAICRQIMHRHGGSIVLQSTGSSGTTFQITLPEVGAALASSASPL